jgi:mannose-1-phosphate guanylyltransferase
MNNNYAIIMAGGVGSRFWPMSTAEKPKQFLDVLGIGKTLIQLTYDRLITIAPSSNIYVVTNEQYANLVKEQLPALSFNQILTEPVRKNTAPCIAYASAKIFATNPNAKLIVAPSDHLIINLEKFKSTIQIGLNRIQEEDVLITLGIKPTRPDTGYGYIQIDHQRMDGKVKKVKQFTEKPNEKLAQSFIESGDYYWNAGIFIWSAQTILEAIKKFNPELHQLFCSNFSAYHSPIEKDLVQTAFTECTDISIDFSVMEKAENVELVTADFDWSDLGTWGSLNEHLEKDGLGNSVTGKNIFIKDSKNCLIKISDNSKAIIQGLENKIIVESDGNLLIIDLKEEQNLKSYLQALKHE